MSALYRKTCRNRILPRTSSVASLRRYFSSNDRNSSGVGDAQVVVCGGGISGVSVAYHLAKRGWTDVLLLEQGRYDKY